MPDDARPFSNCLLDLAPPDIAWFQERSDMVLVPIGSCEQHGAHLPLGTDTITALEVARRAAEQADVPYTAPLWIGYFTFPMDHGEFSRTGVIVPTPDSVSRRCWGE